MLPYQEAEKAILCGLMLYPEETTKEVDGNLYDDEFSSNFHQAFYRVLRTIIGNGWVPDEVTVRQGFEKEAGSIWDVKAFGQITINDFEAKNLHEYVRIVQNGARQRKVVKSLEWGLSEAKKTPLNGETREHLKGIADGIATLAEQFPVHDDDDTEMPIFPVDVLSGAWKEWVDLQAGTTEAPVCYHAASYLQALSLATNRRAWTVCGNHLYLQWYALLVGPTGERKTTVMDRVEEMLTLLDKDAILFGGFGSGEGVLANLAKNRPEKPNVLIRLSEAGKMFRKVLRGKQREAAGGGVSILCDLFDAANRTLDNPVSAGNAKVIAPFVQIFGACTPKVAGMLFQEEALEEGLANRFVFWVGQSKGLLYCPAMPDPTKTSAIFTHITKVANQAASHGEFKLTQPAMDIMRLWYERHHASMDETNKRLQGHMLKFALALAIDDDRISIEAEDLSKAIAVAEYWQRCSIYLRNNWIGSERARVEEKVLKYLTSHGPTKRKDISRHIRISGEILRDAFSSLLRSRSITEDSEHRLVCTG